MRKVSKSILVALALLAGTGAGTELWLVRS